jgi:hypothetical protein
MSRMREVFKRKTKAPTLLKLNSLVRKINPWLLTGRDTLPQMKQMSEGNKMGVGE